MNSTNAGPPPHTSSRRPTIEWVEPKQNIAEFCRESTIRTCNTYGGHIFWAWAEGRRRVYECLHIDGRPLTWTGTGRELMLAFVSFVGALSALVGALLVIKWLNVEPHQFSFRLGRLTLAIPVVYLLGVLAWRGLAHDLERTHWQNNSFELPSAPWQYAWLHFWTAFLVPLTFGWIIPWRAHVLNAAKFSAISHRHRKFDYVGDPRCLYPRFAIAWIGAIAVYVAATITLGLTIGPEILAAANAGQWRPLMAPNVALTGAGIILAGLLLGLIIATWYGAASFNHHISCMRIDRAELQLHIPVAGYMRMVLANMALKLTTLGLWSAYANARFARLAFAYFSMKSGPGTGSLPATATQQRVAIA